MIVCLGHGIRLVDCWLAGCRSGDFNEFDNRAGKQSFSAKLRSSFDGDSDWSPTSVKDVITDRIRSSSKSILEKVLSPTKEKFSNSREKVSE